MPRYRARISAVVWAPSSEATLQSDAEWRLHQNYDRPSNKTLIAQIMSAAALCQWMDAQCGPFSAPWRRGTHSIEGAFVLLSLTDCDSSEYTGIVGIGGSTCTTRCKFINNLQESQESQLVPVTVKIYLRNVYSPSLICFYNNKEKNRDNHIDYIEDLLE